MHVVSEYGLLWKGFHEFSLKGISGWNYKAFNFTSWYFDDLLNIDNIYFH